MSRLPISGAQFDRLGRRLMDGTASDADIATFEDIRLAYGRVLNGVQAALQVLKLPATGRVKTIGTLIDKLRRTPGLTIRGVHDLAGTRIIVPEQKIPKGFEVLGHTCQRDIDLANGRFAQNIAVSAIKSAFAPPVCSKPPKVIDRRAEPSAGYRAVHVIVFYDGIPVEIQVRTDLQHMWAELAERLADRWGRGLRYGLGPDDPDSKIDPDGNLTRADLTKVVLGDLTHAVDLYETTRYKFENYELRLALSSQDQQEVAHVWQTLDDLRPELTSTRDTLRTILESGLTAMEGLGRS